MSRDPYIPAGAGGLSVPLADRSELSIFPRLSTYSQIVAKLQWEPAAIDLGADARAWPELPDERRRRLTTLLAGFRVAEDAVAEHLDAVRRSRRARRHDDDVDLLPAAPRRGPSHRVLRPRRRRGAQAARRARRPSGAPQPGSIVPAALLELFEVRLPAMAAELAAGRAGILDGVSLYHMVLEGAVFTAGQRALLDDLEDDVLPGVREGVEHVELDERWHVGFGVRCLTEAADPEILLDDVLARATEAAAAWGDAVPAETREFAVTLCRRRLTIAGLAEALPAA